MRQVHAYVGRHIRWLCGACPNIEIRVKVILGLLAAEICEVLLLLLRVGVLDVVEGHQVGDYLLI